ncbi:MAG: hypothetical protein OEY06_13640 [Gammaproteobacteria bacterium]|nr:hypothetical protein [Gammaproteobacteria bacterium]
MIKGHNLAFIFLLIATSSVANDVQREIFESNNSIMNFTLTSSKINDVLAYMEKQAVEINGGEGHELTEVCYKNKQNSVRLTFITGVLHDYSTLYGFKISRSPFNGDDYCRYSDKVNENIETKSGLSIKTTKSEIIKILGVPKDENDNLLTWVFDYLVTYENPKHRSWQAGPTYNKYTQHQTITGEYHTGHINGKFDSNNLVSIEIIDYPESDFVIKNEYESKDSLASIFLNCSGGPYTFEITDSRTGKAENYTLIKKDGSLNHSGHVSELTSFSVIWPDNGPSVNNQIYFSGLWGSNSFSGEARSTTGRFTFNGEEFNFFCNWDR